MLMISTVPCRPLLAFSGLLWGLEGLDGAPFTCRWHSLCLLNEATSTGEGGRYAKSTRDRPNGNAAHDVPACAGLCTLFGSGAGEEETAYDERIDEPTMKFIPPQDLSVTTSRPSPSMRAELSARNATGLPRGSLMDV